MVSSTKRETGWSQLLDHWESAERLQVEQKGGSAYFAVMRTIAVLYERHEEHWSNWLDEHNVPKTRAKRPFHSLIKHLATSSHIRRDGIDELIPRKPESSVTSKSWVSRISSALDEWNEVARQSDDSRGCGGVGGKDVVEWLHQYKNHIDGVCEARKARLGTKRTKRLNSTKRLSEQEAIPTTDREYRLTLDDGVLEQSLVVPLGADTTGIARLATDLWRTLAQGDHSVRVVGQYASDDEDDPWVRCLVDDPRATIWEVRHYYEEWGYWDTYSDHPSLDEAITAADALRARLASNMASTGDYDNKRRPEPTLGNGEPESRVANGGDAKLNDQEPPTDRPVAGLTPATETTRSIRTDQKIPPPQRMPSPEPATPSQAASFRRRVCALAIGCQTDRLCTKGGPDYCAEAQRKATQKAA